MSKPSAKKAAAAQAATEGEYAVGPDLIKDVFRSVLEDDETNQGYEDEFFDFAHYHHIMLEREREIIERRHARKLKQIEQKKIEDELLRIAQLRTNPENLYQCASKIQKVVRTRCVQKKYHKLLQSQENRERKKAVIIIVDSWEDKRILNVPTACVEAYELAKMLHIFGYQVDLYCGLSAFQSLRQRENEEGSCTDKQRSSSSMNNTAATTTTTEDGDETTIDGRASPTSPVRSTRPGGLNFSSFAASSLPFNFTQIVPTKAKILSILEEAAKVGAQGDCALWLHIAGVGGTGTVNGKNPSKQFSMNSSQLITPRTRLIRALHGTKTSSLAGDVTHFVFPSDAKSSRLSYDTILSIDEITDVLHARHATNIFNHPMHQKLITMDVAPIGCVDGHVGGGFALIASSSTSQYVYDLPGYAVAASASTEAVVATSPNPATAAAAAGSAAHSPEHQDTPSSSSSGTASTVSKGLWEPHTALLTHGLMQCLLGHAWVQSFGDPCLLAECLVVHIDQLFRAHGIVGEKKGIGWGSMTILCGDRCCGIASQFLEKISGLVPTGNLAFSTTSTFRHGPTKRKVHVNAMRPAVVEVTFRMDITDPIVGDKRVADLQDTEFLMVLNHYISMLCQPDPIAVPPHHRLYNRMSVLRPISKSFLVVSFNGTFVDVSAKCRARGITDQVFWEELLRTLLKPLPVAEKKLHNNINNSNSNSNNSLNVQENSTLQQPQQDHAMQEFKLPAFSLGLGRQHEGSVVLLVHRPSASHIAAASHRFQENSFADMFLPVSSLRLEFSCDIGITFGVYEILLQRARGIFAQPNVLGAIIPAIKPSNSQLTSASKNNTQPSQPPPAFLTGTNTTKPITNSPSEDAAEARTPQQLALSNDSLLSQFRPITEGGRNVLNQFLERLITRNSSVAYLESLKWVPTPAQAFNGIDAFTVEQCLETSLTSLSLTLKHRHVLQAFSRPNRIKLIRVQLISTRVNELDDNSLDILARRERLSGSPVLSSNAGVALCVVGLLHANGEQKSKQVHELHKVARAFEVFANMRFLFWDASEALRSNEQSRVSSLCEGIKGYLGASSFPILLIWDFAKKRYYRARIQGCTFYIAKQISHFCEEFMRGALNDLLPPVKGSKAIGGGQSSTKYLLMSF